MHFKERNIKNLLFKLMVCVCIFLAANQMMLFASKVMTPVLNGDKVISNEKSAFDVSNADEGYIMAKYTGNTKNTIKIIIKKLGGVNYTYNIFKNDEYEVFPLTDGDGSYKITVYEGIGGTKYAVVNSTTVDVNLKNELSPFLYPNQYVWFNKDASVVSLAEELVGAESDSMAKVKKIYDYVINNFSYDYDKISSLKSGYVCNIEDTLKVKKGICLDYSAVMAAMLRSQGVATKLIVGYAETEYHAWISIYSEESGWIENIIYFDGKSWAMMDPTKASTLKESDFKVDEKKYSAKYAY